MVSCSGVSSTAGFSSAAAVMIVRFCDWGLSASESWLRFLANAKAALLAFAFLLARLLGLRSVLVSLPAFSCLEPLPLPFPFLLPPLPLPLPFPFPFPRPAFALALASAFCLLFVFFDRFPCCEIVLCE